MLRKNKNIGQVIILDIGTDHIRANSNKLNKRVTIPSYIAINTNEIIAIGSEALKLKGKTNKNINVSKPIENGVISNYINSQKLISNFIKTIKQKTLLSPIIIASYPTNCNDLQKDSLSNLLYDSGARKTYLVPNSLCVALSNGYRKSPKGVMVIDIGAGKTDISIISYGKVVLSQYIPIAGFQMDKEISNMIKQKYDLLISMQNAKEIKEKVGTFVPIVNDTTIEVSGLNTISEKIQTKKIKVKDISNVLIEVMQKILNIAIQIFENVTPQLVSDVSESQIILAGGIANICRIEQFLNSKLNIEVNKSLYPELSTIRGLEIIADDFKKYELEKR